jgi:hypothetical protein
MLLLRQEIVELLLENRDIRNPEQVELKPPEQVDTRRDQELLTQLSVKIEHLLDERA